MNTFSSVARSSKLATAMAIVALILGLLLFGKTTTRAADCFDGTPCIGTCVTGDCTNYLITDGWISVTTCPQTGPDGYLPAPATPPAKGYIRCGRCTRSGIPLSAYCGQPGPMSCS